MLQKKYDWVQDYIDNAINNGRPLTAQAFEELRKDILELQKKNLELIRELNRWKRPKRSHSKFLEQMKKDLTETIFKPILIEPNEPLTSGNQIRQDISSIEKLKDDKADRSDSN